LLLLLPLPTETECLAPPQLGMPPQAHPSRNTAALPRLPGGAETHADQEKVELTLTRKNKLGAQAQTP